MKQFSGPVARRTFGDVSGNRDCRTSHLTGQTINFFTRKRRSEAIHILDRHDGFLPNAQIPMRPPHFSPFTLHISLVFDFLKLRINNIVILLAGARVCSGFTACRRLFLGIDLLGQFVAGFGQGLRLGFDVGLVA